MEHFSEPSIPPSQLPSISPR